jgi:PAS domain S-box-containing protein
MRLVQTINRSYLAACIILLCALLGHAGLRRYVPTLPPFIILFPAIVITGVFCGTKPALIATLGAVLAADYFWIPPIGAFGPLAPADQITLMVFLIASGCILCATHALRIATERAAGSRSGLESALRAHQAERDRRQAYFDITGALLVVIEANGTIREINHYALKILRHDQARAVVGRDFLTSCIAEPDRAAVRAAIEEAANSGLAQSVEAWSLCQDGALRLIVWQITDLRDIEQAPVTILSGADVTDQRSIETELRGKEARLRAVFQQVPAAVAIVEPPDGRVTLKSDRSDDVLGRDGYAETIGDLVSYGGRHPDGRPYAVEDYPISRALLYHEVVEAEPLIYRWRDGTEVDLSVYAAPIRDDDGSVIAAMGIAFNVTEHKRAQDALKRSEERFRTFADTMPGFLFTTDEAGNLTYLNRQLQTALGLPEGQGLGLRFLDLIRDEDREPVERVWTDREADQRLFETEYCLQYPDGTTRWVLCRIVPVKDELGGIAYRLGIAIDIEDRRHAEAALLESENRLRLALEAGGLGTWSVDIAAGTVQWDARCCEMFGLSPEPRQLSLEAVADLIHPDDHAVVIRNYVAATDAGGNYRNEFRSLSPDQQIRWIVTQGLVQLGEGRIIGINRDVTERRKREDALHQSLQHRELLAREADHRIKNSLQLVASLLALQRQALDNPSAIHAIDSAIARVGAIAETHLALQHSPDFRTILFDQLVKQVCAGLAKLNPAVSIVTEALNPLELLAERAIPLGLVLNELLTNALRHAYPAGESGEIRVSATHSDGLLTLIVADDGIGMPSNTDRRGLGTRVIRSLMGQLKAELAVEQAPSGGTVVKVTLPHSIVHEMEGAEREF